MVGKYLIILIAVVSVIFIGLILFKKKAKKKHKEEQVAAGLQIFNTSGRAVFDSSGNKRYGRIIGSFNATAGGSGSFTVSGLSSGTPFYIVPNSRDLLGHVIVVNFSGNTLSWSSRVSTVIYYGVY